MNLKNFIIKQFALSCVTFKKKLKICDKKWQVIIQNEWKSTEMDPHSHRMGQITKTLWRKKQIRARDKFFAPMRDAAQAAIQRERKEKQTNKQ